MRQLVQNFKTGDLKVEEVPAPMLSAGFVMVENEYSLISAGTEKSTVKVAQASFLGKAKQRPDLVAQVMQNVRKEGVLATVKKVRTKLESLKALGYSSSGIVVASLDSDGRYQPGDRVACAGQDYASHAEIVGVPQNLIAKIPDGVSTEEAGFTTLGAIALQGIRQASPSIGSNVAVIGLGLLGQLTVQLLKANGCNVFGVDLDPRLVELALTLGADAAYVRNHTDLLNAIENFSSGYGCDHIIITAAAPTNDPLVLAAEIARKKATIVVVGAINMDIPRDPHFYRKELDLRMSTSYGPGRYDPSYEESGIDYPYSYVRWTEQRNMEAFLKLIARSAINIKPLISHVFDIADAARAYDLVLGKTGEHYMGVLLKYPNAEDKARTVLPCEIKSTDSGNVCVGFIGAGSFAQSYLIPNLATSDVSLEIVVTSSGINAKSVGQKFGFRQCSTDYRDALNSDRVNTVFIATRHDTHANYVIEALEAGKNVFVEKPLALTEEELKRVELVRQSSNGHLMVGFNRRFSPIVSEIKSEFDSVREPLVMTFRINAGHISKEHWIQNAAIGGGRIIGEMCHFVDLMQFMSDAIPEYVYADSIRTSNNEIVAADNLTVSIKFDDGSVGNLVYLANGDTSMAKERLEIFGGGKVGVVENFRFGKIHQGNRVRKISSAGKGYEQEVRTFLGSLHSGINVPISFNSICATTRCTFAIKDSLSTGLPQRILQP